MKVGDRIRVKASINVYHHPAHKKEAFDIKGMEGEIINILTEWHGRPISPNYPFEVKLGDKFHAHLGDHEIEPV